MWPRKTGGLEVIPLIFLSCVGSIASSCCEQLVLRGLPCSTRLWVTAFGLKASGGRQPSLAQLGWSEHLNSQTDWQRFEINCHLIYKCIEIVLMCAIVCFTKQWCKHTNLSRSGSARQFTTNCTKFNTEKHVLIYAGYVVGTISVYLFEMRGGNVIRTLFWINPALSLSPQVQFLIEEFTLIP